MTSLAEIEARLNAATRVDVGSEHRWLAPGMLVVRPEDVRALLDIAKAAEAYFSCPIFEIIVRGEVLRAALGVVGEREEAQA